MSHVRFGSPLRPSTAAVRGAFVAAAVAVASAASPLQACLPSLSPTVASADELEDLEHEVADVRQQLEEAKSSYLEAVQRQEEARSAADSARAELESVQGRLDERQADLARVVKAQYVSGSELRMLALITSSESVSGLTEAMDYLGHVEDRKASDAMEVLALRDEMAEGTAMLEEAAAAADEAASAAESRKSELEARKEELRPRIDSLMGELKARLNGSAGSAQLSEAMAFLEGVQGVGDAQAAIVRSAYSTGYAGYSMCEAWAEYVYERAGVPIGSFGSAYSSYEAYFVSDDYDEMPVGALAYGSGTSGPYSHVGVCVFNGGGGPDTIWIMDNEGSRQGKAVTLTEWLKWQTAVSWNNGRSGWFGWGVPDGVYLG